MSKVWIFFFVQILGVINPFFTLCFSFFLICVYQKNKNNWNIISWIKYYGNYIYFYQIMDTHVTIESYILFESGFQ